MTPRALLIGVGAIVLLGSAAFHWLVRFDPTIRNVDVFTEMAVSAAYESQSQNPNTPDGKTQLEPPPGAIPRELPPLRYAATAVDAARAGRELSSPFSPRDGEALSRGQKVYESCCLPCHGEGGLGDGPVTRRGVPPPPSLLAPHARAMPDGQMFHLLSLGQGNMASYASQVDRDDRWRAVLFIRSLQGAQPEERGPQQAELAGVQTP